MAGRQNKGAGKFSLDDGDDTGGNAGPVEVINGESGDNANSLGDGGNSGSGDGGSLGDGSVAPGSVLGSVNDGAGSSIDGDDDGIIRDEHGNPTYSPTGRLRKRRNRRAGSGGGSGKAKKNDKVSVTDADVAWFLTVSHLGAANLTATPELELSDNEAKVLAKPIAELLDFYDVEPPREVILWTKLLTALSYIYPPRVAMIKMRLDEERERKRKAAQPPARTVETSQGVSIGEVMPFDPGWTGPRQ